MSIDASEGIDARVVTTVGDLAIDVAVAAPAGSVLALLGPNGAGKSPVLSVLAGHRRLDDGHVVIGGRVLDRPADGVFVDATRRRVGHVLQDLLLFPHLSALDNVAFAPRCAGVGRREARAIATDWLDRFGLGDHADHKPGALSGGQAQRVAIARALAADPVALLLDEPLAALDVAARAEVRRDLRAHLADLDLATVLVTHDPLDALLLADHVVVVEAGRVVQTGTTADLVTRPRTPYVARLAGTNLLAATGRGRTVELDGGGVLELAEPAHGAVFATVAPRAVALHASPPDTSARNVWPVVVSGVELVGERARVTLDGRPPIVAEVTARTIADTGLGPGDDAWVSVKSTEIDVYPR